MLERVVVEFKDGFKESFVAARTFARFMLALVVAVPLLALYFVPFIARTAWHRKASEWAGNVIWKD